MNILVWMTLISWTLMCAAIGLMVYFRWGTPPSSNRLRSILFVMRRWLLLLGGLGLVVSGAGWTALYPGQLFAKIFIWVIIIVMAIFTATHGMALLIGREAVKHLRRRKASEEANLDS